MKTTQRMGRWFGAFAALLLLSAVSFTLTSCGDDDDDDFVGIMFDGEKATITDVVVDEAIKNGVKCYKISIYGTSADGETGCVQIDLAGPLFGKTLNLAKDQTYRNEEGEAIWYTGIYSSYYDEEEGGWVDGIDRWTEEDGFKSGTLYVSLSGGTITVKTQGVTSDDDSFKINYSGKYTEPIYRVKGEVKAKNQAKKNK